MWRPSGERGWRLRMKWKNASVVGLVAVVGLQLRMEQAKRSRAKRHGAGEGGPFSFFSSLYSRGIGGGGGCLWLGLGPGQEALHGRAGEHLDHLL